MRWFTDLVWNPKFLCHIQIFQKSSFKPEDQSAQKKCLATYHLNFLKVKNIARHSMASHTETICMLCFKRKWLHAKKKKKRSVLIWYITSQKDSLTSLKDVSNKDHTGSKKSISILFTLNKGRISHPYIFQPYAKYFPQRYLPCLS